MAEKFVVGDKVICTNLDGILENNGYDIQGTGETYTVLGYELTDLPFPVRVEDSRGYEFYYRESELELL